MWFFKQMGIVFIERLQMWRLKRYIQGLTIQIHGLLRIFFLDNLSWKNGDLN